MALHSRQRRSLGVAGGHRGPRLLPLHLYVARGGEFSSSATRLAPIPDTQARVMMAKVEYQPIHRAAPEGNSGALWHTDHTQPLHIF